MPKGGTSTRGAIACIAGFLLLLSAPVPSSTAGPGSLPPYDGGMSFPSIQGASDPEEFSWEVRLGEGQELVQLDEKQAQVRYEDGHPAFAIDVRPAHDANGADVPTTLRVSEDNVITLIVHHRAGNPAAGGVQFAYPITGGAGWTGGFQTFPAHLEEPKSGDPAVAAPAPICLIPRLIGRSLKASRQQLRLSGCKLGKVRGKRSKTARVINQGLLPGSATAAGTRVSVKLG